MLGRRSSLGLLLLLNIMFHYFLKKRLKSHDLNNNRKLESLIRGQLLLQNALSSNEQGVGNKKPHHIVVSLTSFNRRINDLHLCIESLFQQSIKADVIALWLSTKDFPDKELPELIKKQQKRGLQVFFIDEDIGPYKKYVYAFAHYPDSLIITVDDDTLYPPDTIDSLYRAYEKDPRHIYCLRGHMMTVKGNKLLPYHRWNSDCLDGTASKFVFPTGVGGVLYFPGSLDNDAFNKDKFMSLCPNADDIWLKAMSLKHGTLCAQIPDYRDWKQRFLMIEGSQQSSLNKQNKHKRHGNDHKIQKVFAEYELFEKLTS